MSGFPSKRHWIVIAAGSALALAGGIGWTLIRASNELQLAERQVAHAGEIPFRLTPVTATPVGVAEYFESSSQFKDVAVFEGKLYLCGFGGLAVYSLDGTLEKTYRPGLELPPVPLLAMAAGSAGSGQPSLWIATTGRGLLRYDGRSFVQVLPETPKLRNVTALKVLTSGRVLIGTEHNGVLAFDGKTLTQFHNALSTQHVSSLAGDEADLWIGTAAQGLWHCAAGQVSSLHEADGLPDEDVLSLAQDGDSVYAGTPIGILEVRNGKKRRILGRGLFVQALLARSGRLLAATLEDGIYDLPLASERPHAQPFPALGLAGAVRLASFGEQTFAITSTGMALLTKGAGWREVLKREPGLLTDRNISAVAPDAAGRLWVGYFDRGLDIVDAARAHVVHQEDETIFCINRIVHRTSDSVTAVATANGLALFDASGKERQVLRKSDGLIANHVTDVVFNPNGMTLATPAGLTFAGKSGVHSMYAFHGLVNNHVYALGEANGRLVAGTLGGLSFLDSGFVKASYTTANSALHQNWVTAVLPVAGEWFIGTYGSGVVRIDGNGQWTASTASLGGFEVNPNAMTASERHVYAGTLGKGLAVYDRGQDRWNVVTNGLPSLNVTAVAVTGGSVYVGTDNGLVRLPEAGL